MLTEGTAETGEVGKAGLSGSLGDAAIAPARVTQQRRCFFQATLRPMACKALAAFFEQEVGVTRRDAALCIADVTKIRRRRAEPPPEGAAEMDSIKCGSVRAAAAPLRASFQTGRISE